jgi:hypothetical protein
MKIIVLNRSPKGEHSISLQYVHFLLKRFPQHEFKIINEVGSSTLLKACHPCRSFTLGQAMTGGFQPPSDSSALFCLQHMKDASTQAELAEK